MTLTPTHTQKTHSEKPLVKPLNHSLLSAAETSHTRTVNDILEVLGEETPLDMRFDVAVYHSVLKNPGGTHDFLQKSGCQSSRNNTGPSSHHTRRQKQAESDTVSRYVKR